MVQEAGGRSSSTRGEDYNLYIVDILATNGHIHDELMSVLNSADADHV